MTYVQADVRPGAWRLWAKNEVWNVPETVSGLWFDIETDGQGKITKYRGIAMTLDGKIFGERSLLNPTPSGYQLEGQVSIEGKKYRAFTGSGQLFERADGSLCEVSQLVVCDYNVRKREELEDGR